MVEHPRERKEFFSRRNAKAPVRSARFTIEKRKSKDAMDQG
jgi:hypothetical protein